MKVSLIKGPYDHYVVDISKQPPRISVAGVLYERLDDPDTSEFLGAYIYVSG